MFIFAKLEDVIRRVGLLCRCSVEDVLVEYFKAYAVMTDDGFLDYEVPKKLELLDKKL